MVSLFLNGCSGDLAPVEGQQAPLGREETRKTNFGKLFGDHFLFFGESKKFDPQGVSVAPRVNPYLWQACLDVLSFMPLASVDTNGGMIITEWYSTPEKPSERVKVTARINDRQLRADALTLMIHKQIRNRQGDWINADVEKDIVLEMEDIILTKARQLRIKSTEQ